MRICTNCGTTNSDSSSVCKRCGSPIKSVNSVVVRTNYRKNVAPTVNPNQRDDFNPVQDVENPIEIQRKVFPAENAPSKSIKPNISNLEYKFHSSPFSQNTTQDTLPLKSIPPTPAENLVIPKPIIPREHKTQSISSLTNASSVLLSENSIQNEDLQEIPQQFSSQQAYTISRVSVPPKGSNSDTDQSFITNPLMTISSQSIQSQQIEQEMTSIMSVFKEVSIPKLPSQSAISPSPSDVKHDHSIPNSLDDILTNLSQLDLNIEASALVNLDGKIVASAISERFDKFLISTITNTLGTISQDVISSLESGDLKFISIFATKGILFLAPIMKNVFLVLYTSSDAKIGLISLARMIVKKKIELFYAKHNLRKSPV